LVVDATRSSLRSDIAVMFQDFEKFQMTVREYVAFGRTQTSDRATTADASADARVADALHRAGADQFVAGLPQGLDSMLGPQWMNGSDLSLGQWQRLALARAFYRDAGLVILDEPTASLDAHGEADLFGRLRDLANGRTVLLISHRFAGLTDADNIVVLDDAQIVEVGSHRELLANGKIYAALYRSQAERFSPDA
jgi:ATP-binding cassette, subfamily B, bacterial